MNTESLKNVSYLGRCYDILDLDPLQMGLSSKAKQVIDLTMKEPVPDGSVAKPKNTDYRPLSGGSINSQSELIRSTTEFHKRFSQTIEVSGGVPGIIECSASTSYETIKEQTEIKENVVTYCEYKVNDYGLELKLVKVGGNDELHKDYELDRYFRETVTSLKVDGNDSCSDFVKKFGTHFVSGVTMGGRCYQTMTFSKEAVSILNAEKIDIKIAASGTFKKFAGGASSTSELGSSEKLESVKGFEANDIQHMGGTPNSDLDAWAQTVKDDPDPIELKLIPIYLLFTRTHFADDDQIELKKEQMQEAVESFLKNKTKREFSEPSVEKSKTYLGVGTDHQLYTLESLNHHWVLVPKSGAVIDVTKRKDGTLLGVGTDHQLYTRKSLDESWQLVPASAAIIGILEMEDYTLLGVGTDYQLYTRKDLNQKWHLVTKSGAVINVTKRKDGTLLGVGTDHQLYTRKSLDESWQLVPASAAIIGILEMEDYTLLGVGTDYQLYTRTNLHSAWMPVVPSSGAVLNITMI